VSSVSYVFYISSVDVSMSCQVSVSGSVLYLLVSLIIRRVFSVRLILLVMLLRAYGLCSTFRPYFRVTSGFYLCLCMVILVFNGKSGVIGSNAATSKNISTLSVFLGKALYRIRETHIRDELHRLFKVCLFWVLHPEVMLGITLNQV
jgi:TRAP-type uncharacterized transport system fused permease subunit